MAAADFDLARAAQVRRWSAGVAEMVLRAFADSGLSRIEFAARHGIHEQRIYQWQRRLALTTDAMETPPVVFRELSGPLTIDSPRSFELVLPSGMVLRIPAAFDATALRQLLVVLRGDD